MELFLQTLSQEWESFLRVLARLIAAIVVHAAQQVTPPGVQPILTSGINPSR